MAKKQTSNSLIWFRREVLHSKAYFKLSGTQIRVLNELYCKRQVAKTKRVSNSKGKWVVTNNGEIVLPRITTAEKLALSESSFTRAIKRLIEVGFVDVAYQGGLEAGDMNKYSLSERWKKYGEEDFVKGTFPFSIKKQGFKLNNKLALRSY